MAFPHDFEWQCMRAVEVEITEYEENTLFKPL